MIAGVQTLAVRAFAARYDRSLVRRPLLDPRARRPHRRIDPPLNFLLIGSADQGAPETGPCATVVMIGHATGDSGRAHLVGVPHDLRLDLPAPAASDHSGANLVGAALAGGAGPEVTQRLSVALAGLMDIRFDGAAIIDLDAISRVIDLLGGVQVLVPAPLTSAETGTEFRPGQRRMAGSEALDYAGRHPADRDRDHRRRHQQVWRATAARLADVDVIANPLRLDRVVRGIGSGLVIDTNDLSLEELAGPLQDLRCRELSGVEVPVRPPPDGARTHTLPGAEAPGLFGSLRDGDLDSWARENPRWVNRL